MPIVVDCLYLPLHQDLQNYWLMRNLARESNMADTEAQLTKSLAQMSCDPFSALLPHPDSNNEDSNPSKENLTIMRKLFYKLEDLLKYESMQWWDI